MERYTFGMQFNPKPYRQAVELQHGGKAQFVETVHLREEFEGKLAWECDVHVFKLDGVRAGKRAYAWSVVTDETPPQRRVYSALHAGPVKSPRDAVRAAIVAESLNAQNEAILAKSRATEN
jgi:hypothetical protein